MLLVGLLGPAIWAERPPVDSEPEHPAVEPAPGTGTGKVSAGAGVPAPEPPREGGVRDDDALPVGGAPPRAEEKDRDAAPGQISPTPADDAVPVGVAVVGRAGRLLYGPAEVRVAADGKWGVTALGALDATGLDYAVSPRWPGFVELIAGERNRGQAGWMYQVNGEVPPVAADRKRLRPGDRVIWWYSESLAARPPTWEELTARDGRGM